MKRKLLLTLFMAVMLVCALAICVSATTYNYYEDEVNEANKLYSIEASFGAKNTRFELISSITGEGFAKADAQGTPLTWYVVEDDLDSDGDGVRNIVVKSTPTLNGDVGTTDEKGNYTYYVAEDGTSYSKKVVSVNFFGLDVKTLPEQAYMATYIYHEPGQKSQYCQIADGSYLLALYLPKTLTYIPKQLCFRSPVIFLEFEDNRVIYKNFGEGVKGFDPQWKDEIAYAFSFCGNLKSLVVPEGIETIDSHTFRNAMSLSFIKFPSTMTRLESNVFFQSIAFETVVYGENMTYIGYLNATYTKVYNDWGIKNYDIKYIYVPNTLSQTGSAFDSYAGTGNNALKLKNVVFFFAGTKEEAKLIYDKKYTGVNFRNAYDNLAISYGEYLANKETYDNYNGSILVYNISKCEAFRDGEHYNLENGVCTDCGAEFYCENAEHNREITITYTSYDQKGVRAERCIDCDSAVVLTEAPALFTCLGYSANEVAADSLLIGFTVNKASLNEYEAISGTTVSFGLFAVTKDRLGNQDVINENGEIANGAIWVEISSNFVDDAFMMKITGFTGAQCDIDIIMGAFVKATDGEGDAFSFLQAEKALDGEKYSYTSLNKVLNK